MQDILHAIKLWIISKFKIKEEYNPLIEEVEWLRMELAKRDEQVNLLIGKLTNVTTEVTNTAETNMTPIQPSYVPFHVRRQQLERDSIKRAAELKLEKEMKIAGSKTTAELENELLNGEANG